MSDPLPLAAAQRRLGRPGRPRKHPENGHNVGQTENGAPQPRENTPQNDRETGARVRRTPVVTEKVPRGEVVQVPPALLSIPDAGRYLGLKPRTIRELIKREELPPVRPPAGSSGARRVLVSRLDLDALVRRWQGRP
jgi:excisionase family DNA binding protein